MYGLLLLFLFPMALVGLQLLIVLVPLQIICVVIPLVLLMLRFLFARGAARAASAFLSDRPLPSLSRWYSCLAAVILTAGLSLASRAMFIQSYKIPTGGMEPTMLIGDHLLAVNWAYGWREPISGRLISDSTQPKRGDLMVFRFPEDRSVQVIKRCVGLPGETVEIRGRAVPIDGRAIDEPYVQFLEPPPSSTGQDSSGSDPRNNWGPQIVPAESYFVLGDNRDNSRDSRFWGFVPHEDLLGRAAVVYWSHEATRDHYRPKGAFQWLRNILIEITRTRWDRLGHRLE